MFDISVCYLGHHFEVDEPMALPASLLDLTCPIIVPAVVRYCPTHSHSSPHWQRVSSCTRYAALHHRLPFMPFCTVIQSTVRILQ